MKPHGDSMSFNSTMLTANIILAHIDVNGLMEYALTAGLGGAIWLGYKILVDHVKQYRKAQSASRQS